mmetsp:Transcript_31701/g.61097  ORF Transcript_31701/g.61097 Transcript_31701/m.61097 type:complete len:138 (+) Transcript_31701:232-645(+)
MDQGHTFNNDLTSLMDRLDLKILRPLQKQAFLCNAKCCDSSGSSQEVQQCMLKCTGKVEQMNQVMSQELKQFQNQLMSCGRRCQESAQESMYMTGDRQPSDKEMEKLQGQVEKCAGSCYEQYRKLLPKLAERISSHA